MYNCVIYPRLINRFLEASLKFLISRIYCLLLCTVYVNVVLPVFALGWCFTSGCVLLLITNSLVHAGVGVKACAWLQLHFSSGLHHCEAHDTLIIHNL